MTEIIEKTNRQVYPFSNLPPERVSYSRASKDSQSRVVCLF